MPAKDPNRVIHPVLAESGKNAARARWGVPRRVRLDALSDPERELVLAYVQALKAAKTSKGGE